MLLRVYLKYKDYHISKDFEVSVAPQVGWQIGVPVKIGGGNITVDVRSITQYVGEDFLQVICDASLYALCILYLGNNGWTFYPDDFAQHSDVQKKLATIEKARSRCTDIIR